jgi:hypothetical protein
MDPWQTNPFHSRMRSYGRTGQWPSWLEHAPKDALVARPFGRELIRLAVASGAGAPERAHLFTVTGQPNEPSEPGRLRSHHDQSSGSKEYGFSCANS